MQWWTKEMSLEALKVAGGYVLHKDPVSLKDKL